MPDKAYIHSSIYRSELSYFHTFYLLLAASHLGSILPPSLCLPLKQISTCHQVDVAIHKLLLLLLLRLLTQQQQQQQRALSCLTIKVRPLPTPHAPPCCCSRFVADTAPFRLNHFNQLWLLLPVIAPATLTWLLVALSSVCCVSALRIPKCLCTLPCIPVSLLCAVCCVYFVR